MDAKQIDDDVCDRKESRVPMLMGKRCQSLGETPRHKNTAQLDDDAGATRTRPDDTGVTRSSAGDYDQKGNYLRGIIVKVPAFGKEGASFAAVTASCNLARPSSSATRSSAQASQAAQRPSRSGKCVVDDAAKQHNQACHWSSRISGSNP